MMSSYGKMTPPGSRNGICSTHFLNMGDTSGCRLHALEHESPTITTLLLGRFQPVRGSITSYDPFSIKGHRYALACNHIENRCTTVYSTKVATSLFRVHNMVITIRNYCYISRIEDLHSFLPRSGEFLEKLKSYVREEDGVMILRLIWKSLYFDLLLRMGGFITCFCIEKKVNHALNNNRMKKICVCSTGVAVYARDGVAKRRASLVKSATGYVHIPSNLIQRERRRYWRPNMMSTVGTNADGSAFAALRSSCLDSRILDGHRRHYSFVKWARLGATTNMKPSKLEGWAGI
ncbi:hypothetical protein IFM89_027744 [Coptis chinensis]|uniref:Uncharacterized protein n=1 Tax=Coptis chinensis TaxID=261450 RepID=A0A835LT86_9MAGN|nr:hypothetical protein IFM89_027744 [Coptis chinensis]